MSETQNMDGSRRSFLKKVGLGAGAALAAMIPSATGALKITKNGIFSTNESATSGGASLILEKVSSDPGSAEVGQMWYRTDKD